MILYDTREREIIVGRLRTFQLFIDTHDHIEILQECVNLSHTIFEHVDSIYSLFHYDDIQLFNRYTHQPVTTGDRIEDLWIVLPCVYANHRGVRCSVITYFDGVGCLDCSRLYR